MDTGRDIIDNVQIWASEYGHVAKSNSARNAGEALRELHRDLPEIIGTSSEILSRVGIDAGSSRTTSRRLADATTREIIASSESHLDNQGRLEIVRRSLRGVLIQEAAGNELERRAGKDPVRALDRDVMGVNGDKALATLRRQGVDVDRMFGHMTEHDLAQTARGAYDKVSLLAHPHLVKALETGDRIMSDDQIRINREISPEEKVAQPRLIGASPAVNPLRHRLPVAPVRQVNFGRRIAAVQAQQAVAQGM